MPKKLFSAEQIVTVLRQIEVLMSQGKAAPDREAERTLRRGRNDGSENHGEDRVRHATEQVVRLGVGERQKSPRLPQRRPCW